MNEFELKMMADFDKNKVDGGGRGGSHNYSDDQMQRMKQDHVAKKVTECKPSVKYVKTFVPIFPWLYESLGQGSHIGCRKNLSLTGTARHIHYNPDDGSNEREVE